MMGMITALMAMLYAYVEARFVLVLAVPVWVKVIFSFFLGLGIFNLIVDLQWGYLLPEWVWRLFSIAQVLLIYALLATIVLDVLRLFHVHTTSVAIGLAVVCLGAAAYAGWHAASLPIVKEVLIESDHLPADWQPLKIAQLTDLHIGQGFNQKWLKQVVDKTNALHPDVIVITGDSIDNTVDQLLAQMEPLGQLKAPLGVYMVFGNHEYYYGPDAWEEAFEKMGISVLHQKHVLLRSGAQTVALGGGTWGARYHPKRQDARLREIFDGVQLGVPRILLAHYPAVFPAAAQQDVLLQLSGHTHGGMTFPINLITKAFNSGYLRGLYQEDGRFLYVSDGTGLWGGLPARIGTQNEITLITVKRP